ncbi:hypothetical protein PEP31012_03563 [Pandoraea eparura]|uniref:Uncharacterized protein n=1 Tax=Pandoraea eparura TaxID=2508291 RepID=A0A5E4WZC0_9BURK|nr:hypothetical protein PEP31012_03563 [Pandoraea eparura]
MIARIAKARGGQRCWFDRGRIGKSRRYHVFGLSRIVWREGSCWRLVIGPLCIAFGYRDCKGTASQAAEERKS